jgi:hypothetical protein
LRDILDSHQFIRTASQRLAATLNRVILAQFAACFRGARKVIRWMERMKNGRARLCEPGQRFKFGG